MKLGFIGCGRMGQALLAGVLRAGVVSKSDVWIYNSTPESSANVAKQFDVQVAQDKSGVIRECDVVLLGCKPYQVEQVLGELNDELPGNTVILSVAAGITLARMEKASPKGTRLIRVMPNTPSLIGCGASGVAAGTCASESDLMTARTILESVGIVEITTENQLDALTALSGSGPAYIYTLIESLAGQAQKEGLPADTALRLATQTVIGAGRMVESTGMTPKELRDQVTSPGGTTLAGLEALTDHGFESSIAAGVHAAAERSREIAAGA